MPKGLIFWILMLILLVFSLWSNWPIGLAFGGTLVFFILLVILGWAQFGPPVQ